MPDGALTSPREKVRGGTSGSLLALLAVAAVGGGLYLAKQRADRRAPRNNDSIAQIAALARAEKDNEWLQLAIRERRAIIGMTFREVETAKGRPHRKHRGDDLPEDLRARGGVESWVYNLDGGAISSVLFGPNGFVIHATDVEGQTGPGHAIRQ
jgi:hypothetical protein